MFSSRGVIAILFGIVVLSGHGRAFAMTTSRPCIRLLGFQTSPKDERFALLLKEQLSYRGMDVAPCKSQSIRMRLSKTHQIHLRFGAMQMAFALSPAFDEEMRARYAVIYLSLFLANLRGRASAQTTASGTVSKKSAPTLRHTLFRRRPESRRVSKATRRKRTPKRRRRRRAKRKKRVRIARRGRKIARRKKPDVARVAPTRREDGGPEKLALVGPREGTSFVPSEIREVAKRTEPPPREPSGERLVPSVVEPREKVLPLPRKTPIEPKRRPVPTVRREVPKRRVIPKVRERRGLPPAKRVAKADGGEKKPLKKGSPWSLGGALLVGGGWNTPSVLTPQFGLAFSVGYDRWTLSLQGVFLAQRLSLQARFVFPFRPALLVSYALWRAQEDRIGPSFSLLLGVGMRSWLVEERFSLQEYVGIGVQFGAQFQWSFSRHLGLFVRASAFYMPPFFSLRPNNEGILGYFVEVPVLAGLAFHFF
ncbi:MAG: hypothetical protein H6728_04135 [Myxococcales bacterium]|nr:hypothetical protein [Myxococcales bacterium]